MAASDIVIKGAREHNLRDVNLVLPRNQLICLTGVSGSGKSSLAFDTLYAEGQRRYVESLSSFARQFLGQMPKPDVDYIGGLSPSISISQKSAGNNPRSTVGTITEIYDYLRILFARVGDAHCPQCRRPISAQTREQLIGRVMQLPPDTKFSILAPVIRGQKGEYRDLFLDLLKQGFVRARVDGTVVALSDDLRLDRQMRHDIEVVIDRLVSKPTIRPRLAEAVELALRIGQGTLIVAMADEESAEEPAADTPHTTGKASKQATRKTRRRRRASHENDLVLSLDFACADCGIGFEPPSPQLFSFNSPQGMCLECDGLGEFYSFDRDLLIPDPRRSFKQGCIELLGPWKDLGRWRRHIYQGVAESIERKQDLAAGTMLETPWQDLEAGLQNLWLWGTGDDHITFTYRGGNSPMKYGGTFEGLIPSLLKKYRETQSRMQQRQLEKYMSTIECPDCHGERLNAQARAFSITTSVASFAGDAGDKSSASLSLPAVCRLPVRVAAEYFQGLVLDKTRQLIATDVLKEIRGRLGFLMNVGLDYLTLDRPAPTLSGGESQRIRLAGQVGCGLVGVLYILDEPSIGLHPRDNERLLETLQQLRDLGNTVVVVEHDEDTMRAADYLVDFGPGPGVRGGEIVAEGPISKVMTAARSVTGRFLSGSERIEIPARRRLSDAASPLPFAIPDGAEALPRQVRESSPSASKLWPPPGRAAGGDRRGLPTDAGAEGDDDDLDDPEDDNRDLFRLASGEGAAAQSSASDRGNRGRKRDEESDGDSDGDGADASETVRAHARRRAASGRQTVAWGDRRDLSKVKGPVDLGREWLTIHGARFNNLQNIDVHLPLGAFVCVTGVSGSGKSSLVNDILVEALRRDLNGGEGDPGDHDRITGLHFLDKLIAIDQTPIGRTPRSNPGTYIKVFDDIRTLFTQLPESKQRGYKPGRFSFNVEGGRCQACEGNGSTRLEMDFLADVWVTCPVCEGHRFNRETLGVRFKNKSIADVLEMDIQDALRFFDNIPNVRHKLQTLHDVGLDYLKIGQPSPTLSGGEAQRVKLARELIKKSTGRTLYLLDEPTTGLHFADIKLLLKVLHDFADAGNTVLVVEHNLDVIKTADWVIDLGPEGGGGGGQIVAAGTPEQVAACAASHTGRALAPVLGLPASASPPSGSKGRVADSRHDNGQRGAPHLAREIQVTGARQHNLRDVSVTVPRDRMTVFCGPSGSGKSSLAMDTIYAEGQRRYVESLSAYARQFVSQMQKPQVEQIAGLSPAIAIEQQNLGHSPRSTVGTTTEIYDYLRILMARLGRPHCPDCGLAVGTQTMDEIIEKVMDLAEGTRLYLMAPSQVDVGQQYEALWEDFRSHGYIRVRIDGQTYSLDQSPQIDRRRKHQVEVVVDRVVVKSASRSRIAESIETALAIGKGVLHVATQLEGSPEPLWPVTVHSQHLACAKCGRSFEALTPHNFSFNSQLGWCPSCEGLGTQVGANPAALINHGRMTLAEGALNLWPSIDRKVSLWMLGSLSRGTGVPTDVPFEELDGRQRRVVMYGAGERWFDVYPGGKIVDPARTRANPLFRFQYKGLYPALEEAARLSPSLRAKLDHLVDEVECAACGGSRLREDAAAARFQGATIDQLCRQPLGQLLTTVQRWKLAARERKIAGELVREVINRVEFLNDVGLEYLTLNRGAATLSGGEAQRIRLASQLGSGLTGVLYVLDEPTIGLHPRDNKRLIRALHKLRDLGNTLLLVEHDKEVIAGSDAILDFGPGAGKFGGNVVAQGTPAQLAGNRNSVTGPFLSGAEAIPIPLNRRSVVGKQGRLPAGETLAASCDALSEAPPARRKKASRPAHRPGPEALAAGAGKSRHASSPEAMAVKAALQVVDPVKASPAGEVLRVVGARHHNLREIDVALPLGTFTAVTGVSGSGKSSLINDVLYAALAKRLHRTATVPGAHREIQGIEYINKVIRVDQQPLGNSPTSNPATYTQVFDLIRELFAQLPESKVRGYTSRRFSFNVPGGRCDHCDGNGQLCIEMHFLPDVWVECQVCRGHRYNAETLSVRFHGHSIADVLELTCADAVELFRNIPKIRRILQTLCDVGLDYLTLGQAAPTLSGGEAQRVKLAAELARPDTGRTLYLLDEPTTGLHFNDLTKLLEVLNRLVDLGNTVVVIEHNLDVIKTADWVIDIGPEAGDQGGLVVVQGTPETVAAFAAAAKPAAAAAKKSQGRAVQAKNGTAGPLRSHTAEALAEILAAGPYTVRPRFDPRQLDETKPDDLEISDVGRTVSMPWQVDGRRWHTQDRVGRKGEPCQWDGRILGSVVDRIQQHEGFSETNWDSRGVVEIAAEKKADGWFFHAITGEAWLLKMKFRVARNTFKRDELTRRIDLPTLNQMEELPVYGNEPRVKCKNQRGPWQEIEIRAHTWEEIDKPEFWKFLDDAVAGFHKHTDRVSENPEELMPWKKLGRVWHFARKGFPPRQTIRWDTEALEELCDLIEESAPGGQFLWNNQQLVHYYLPDTKQPWVTIRTKQPEWLEVHLLVRKDLVAFGQLTEIGSEPDLDTAAPDRDVVKLRFRKAAQLRHEGFVKLIKAHAQRG